MPPTLTPNPNHQPNNYPQGPVARRFFATIDRVVKLQSPVIEKLVERMETENDNSNGNGTLSVAQRQAKLDKYFMNAATGTGAGTGGVAAWPGIGTALSFVGIAAEAVLLLELAAVYALASAHLHGADISTEEQRRTVVLLAVSGTSDKQLIEVLAKEGVFDSMTSAKGLLKKSSSDMVRINSVLGRMAWKQVKRRFRGAVFSKVLPLGVGVVLGAVANRKIAKSMIDSVHSYINQMA